METVLRAYVRFYRALAPWRDGFIVAPFDRVTADLGDSSVRSTSASVPTSCCCQGLDEARDDAFALIDDRARRPSWMR